MRKFILMALAGTAIALAAPASATPLSLGSGLGTAADNVSTTEQVHHRGWHHRPAIIIATVITTATAITIVDGFDRGAAGALAPAVSFRRG